MAIRLPGPASQPTDGSLPSIALADSRPLRRDPRRDAAAVLLVAAGYFVGTKVGFALTSSDMPIATFWPPNAILLAAFILAPFRLWWMFLVAVIPAHFLAQLNNGIPVSTAAGWLVGNAGEALLGATLIRLGGATELFRTVSGVTKFLLFGFVIAPFVTTFLDAAIVVGTNWGRDYWDLWITRLFSNMLAQLAIVPLIVAIGQRGSPVTAQTRRDWLHAALLAVAIVTVGLLVFRTGTLSRPNLPALIYLPLPLLLWAAMRFGPVGLSASLLTISLISVHSLMQGRGPFISSSPAGSVLSMQVFLCMIGVPLLVLAAVMMERRRAEISLGETSYKLIDAQERERRRIARELHDDIGQTLTLAQIELDRMIADQPDRREGAALTRLRAHLSMISQALWELSHGLYPSSLEYLGLATALKRLCSDLRAETGVRVHCETPDAAERFPEDVSLCLYRVTQEALQNIVKHSHAATVSVTLRLQRGQLVLQITDDGVGFDPGHVEAGVGLASMRERLRAMQGEFDIVSSSGRGARLTASVAFRAALIDDAALTASV